MMKIEQKNFQYLNGGKRKEIHSRLPRGAVCKFTSSLNSAISNIKNGNIKKFEMKYRSKKIQRIIFILKINNTQKIIDKIKSHFWFRTKDKKTKDLFF